MTSAEVRAYVLQDLTAKAPAWGFTKVNPLLMLAQADLETGDFTSNLCMEYNNVYGMTGPNSRRLYSSLVVAEGGMQFCAYSHVGDSVTDYLARQKQFRIPDTSDALAYIHATVASGYATDPNYAVKWAERARVVMESEDPAVTTNDKGSNVLGLLGIAAVLTVLAK